MERADQADKASTQLALQKSQVDLATFLQEAGAEPRLQRISLRIKAKQKSVDDRLQRHQLAHGGRATRFGGPQAVSEVPGPDSGRPVVRDGLRSSEREGPTREAPGLGPCCAGHLRPGSRGVRRCLDPGGAVAVRVEGEREGQGGRRLLQPAADLIAGGEAGRRAADPRPGSPASPEDDRRVPPPPRRVPRAHGRPRGPGPRESGSQPDRSGDGAGLLPQRSRAGLPPPVCRSRSSPQLGRASRSRSDLGPSLSGVLLLQHAAEGVEPGQDQPHHVYRQSIPTWWVCT